ncbi:MAG TPA: endonuclease, partial [Myxococcota bacterium]|nr:endonuclease [Myxococcota bacterium]
MHGFLAEVDGVDSAEPDTHDTDAVDTREVDAPDEVEPDSSETLETLDTEDDSDALDVPEEVDVSEVDVSEDSEVDIEVEPDTGVDTFEEVADDTGVDTLEDVESDTVDVLEDLDDGDLADGNDLADPGPDADDDTAEDVADADTTEPIDTIDNPCLFPSGLLPDRYRPMAELRGAELRVALQAFVTEGSVGFDYDAARDLMYGITDAIDVDPDLTIECVYTGYRRLADGTRSPGSGLTEITTEHSWPRSDGAGVFPAEGDIHHLFPALAPANNNRGNDEFGDVACGVGWPRSCAWADGGSFLGPAIDGRSSVFQVRPEHRGDIARAHFYFAVRYNRPIPELEEIVLRRWHCEDPPSPR